MVTTAQKLRDARLMASLSVSDLARLAGVSLATVSRAEAGKVVPSADAYLKLLSAAGFTDAGDRVERVSHPSALWTARWLLGDLDDEPADAQTWTDAWRRIRLVGDDRDVPDPESLAFRAGRSAALSARPGAVTALGPVPVLALASTLASAGVDYAVSGDAALERLGSTIVPAWPVVYVSAVRPALESLGLSVRLPGEQGPVVTLLPFDGSSETRRVVADDDVWFVSPLQAVLDGYGGDGRMVEQSEAVVRSWAR